MKKPTALEAFYGGMPFEKVCQDYHLQPKTLRLLVQMFPLPPDVDEKPVFVERLQREYTPSDRECLLIASVYAVAHGSQGWVSLMIVKQRGWPELDKKGQGVALSREIASLKSKGFLDSRDRLIRLTEKGLALAQELLSS